LPHRAEDGVVFLGGVSWRNEIDAIVDLIVTVVVLSVRSTGHWKEFVEERIKDRF
jgi:hypothetical protein